MWELSVVTWNGTRGRGLPTVVLVRERLYGGRHMGACSGCASPLTEVFYTSNGDAVCRRCYYAEQTRAQDARALESLAANAPPGFKVTGVRSEGSETSTRTGFLLLGCCIASVLFTGFLLGRIYVASGLLGLLGLAAFARALALKRQQRGRTSLIIAGIAATVLVLLGLVAVTILGV
jgi:hypothetical protein